MRIAATRASAAAAVAALSFTKSVMNDERGSLA